MTDAVTTDIFIDAPRARVWAALADAEPFGRWFRCRFAGPFVPGERIEGTLEEPGHEGTPFWVQVTAMEPPAHFAFRWPWGEASDLAQTTLVTFRLVEEGQGTRVTITESGFDAMPEGQRATMAERNAEGWKIQAGRIKAHVEGSDAG
ncbi:SRPBCC family protein [Pseudoroseicyclus sp. H15]